MDPFVKYASQALAITTVVVMLRKGIPQIDGWVVFVVAFFVSAGLAFALNPVFPGWGPYARDVFLCWAAAVAANHLAARAGGKPSPLPESGDPPSEPR